MVDTYSTETTSDRLKMPNGVHFAPVSSNVFAVQEYMAIQYKDHECTVGAGLLLQ